MSNTATKQSTGFVGLGLMGAPMAARLMDAGYPLRIHNRTREKAFRLVERGAVWCQSPADVAASSHVVFSMVTNDDALTAISLGPQGICNALPEGGLHVDCSTVSPDITTSLEQHYAFDRKTFYHMPVLGGPPQAADGSLLLFLGGDPDMHGAVEEYLSILGKQTWRFPTARQATATKIVCNSFIAGLLVTMAQGLVFAAKAGVGSRTLLEILDQSALNSNSLQRKGKAMLERRFAPSFFVENLLKDTNLMLEAAHQIGVPAAVAETARELLEEAVKMGLGRSDYSAAIKVWERVAEIEVKG